MPIVTDLGFQTESAAELIRIDDIDVSRTEPLLLLLKNDDDPARLVGLFARVELIVVSFPTFDDGRGFSLAQRLRKLGYTGHLRAQGHVVSDQYPMARSCGFDDVEIDDALAERQSEAHWLEAGRLTVSYRRKLSGMSRRPVLVEETSSKAA